MLLAFTLFIVLVSRIRLYFFNKWFEACALFNGFYVLTSYFYDERRRSIISLEVYLRL